MIMVETKKPPSTSSPVSTMKKGTTAEVQAELQQYLKDKNLNDIFVDIVENILLAKPNNPIGFIMKYILGKYPDETKEFLPVPSVLNMQSASAESNDDSSESNDDETDDDESDDDVSIRKPASSPSSESMQSKTSKNRRTSVCAEKMSVHTTLESSEVKHVPKTEKEAEQIQKILKKNVLFQHLDEQQLLTVQNAMVLVEKEDNDIIIQQGDDGDNFYILERGNVNVFLNSKSKSSKPNVESSQTKKAKEVKDEGENNNALNEKNDEVDETPITTYEDGDSFGELAIMYNAPRAATCVAEGKVRLWALDRVSFKIILMQTTIEKRNKYKQFLQQVSLLSEMTEYELLTIADALQEEFFETGDTICKEGEKGDKFYIIKEGTATCLKTNKATGEEIQVASLSNGSYFGEIALVTSKTRQATVKALCGLRCLCVDRKTFKRVMGPLQDILMRNIASYNKFQASSI